MAENWMDLIPSATLTCYICIAILEINMHEDDEEQDPKKCTQCGYKAEFYSELCYSQGNKVCKKCKENNQESDNRAFDNYIYSRRM